MYLGRAGPNHTNSCNIPLIGNVDLLQHSTFQSIDRGSSGGSIEVGIQGLQTNLNEANLDMRNSIRCVGVVVTLERPLKQARISKVLYKIEK